MLLRPLLSHTTTALCGQIRAALEYVVGEHVGGARSSERETRLINTVAQALVGEEELANPTKVRDAVWIRFLFIDARVLRKK